MTIKYKVLKANRQSIIVPETSRFCLKYKKDTIVKCVKGSIGIMVFENRHDALEFSNRVQTIHNIIIKVRPIGKAKNIPVRIAAFNIYKPYAATKNINRFNILLSTIKYYSESDKISAIHKAAWAYNIVPQGTQCYNAVEVLE